MTTQLDALLPGEIAERAEQVGIAKAARDLVSTFALAGLVGLVYWFIYLRPRRQG